MTLAKEGKQQGWWQSYDLPYSNYVGLEAEAVAVSGFHSSVVPASCRRLITPALSMKLRYRKFRHLL